MFLDQFSNSLTLSAPSCLLLLLPAERQASLEWPKLFKLRAIFFFGGGEVQKTDFLRRTMEISQKVSKM